nr:hypothetical protein [Tanacetum cinerariifolium]
MVDYSLWEFIENGNSPPITKVVEGVETTIAPATAEEKAQRRLELKARRTFLMDIPNKHQSMINSIKDSKSLLECRAPRNKENKNRENSRRSVPVETPASTALVSCDGLGDYD